MKAILVMGLFVVSTSAFSAIFKSYDSKESCDLYRVASSEEVPQTNEVIVSSKKAYGFSFSDLDINFEDRKANVQIIINVAMGFNTPLLKLKSSISADRADFTSMINRVNRKMNLLENICVSSENKIVYANPFADQEE